MICICNLRVIGVIQARMSSQRLPSKVLLEILGKPILWHIHNRMKNAKLLSDVVISTGEYENNAAICDFAKNNDIKYFSGNEADLIDRLYKTALSFDASAIVRITADCPLVDPKIIDTLVTEFINKHDKYDIITNCQIRTFPHGLDAEVYSVGILKEMWQEIKDVSLREWFPFYIEKNPSKFRILNIADTNNRSQLRWTVDYPEDLEFVKQVYTNLYNENSIFVMEDILNLLKNKPELSAINSKYAGLHNVNAPQI